jgi:hypothetical protein
VKRKTESLRQMEESDKPLDAFDRLVSKSSWRRNVRLVTDPTNGKLGLLLALKPQGPSLHDEGLQVISYEETLPTYIEIAPGMRIRPKLRVSLMVEMDDAQMVEYERYYKSMKLPATPITP